MIEDKCLSSHTVKATKDGPRPIGGSLQLIPCYANMQLEFRGSQQSKELEAK